MDRRAFLVVLAAATAFPAFGQQKMRIGVIGSGRIGSTLGGLWAKAGHEVMFSDRDAETAKHAAEGAGAHAKSGTVEEAIAFGDAVLIAVPYGALPAIAKQVGDKLKGKVVVDPNNPVPSRDGDQQLCCWTPTTLKLRNALVSSPHAAIGADFDLRAAVLER